MKHNTPLPQIDQRQRLSPRPLFASIQRPARSLYIHVPFCFHKCHYCDFYSFVDTRDRQQPFIERLSRELHALAPAAQDLPLHTIFVGGGTPSLLAPHLWTTLLHHLHAAFDLSLIRSRAPGTEFTVECNPETVSPELLAILAGGGVSRVSLGAQSFNTAHLKTLERWHNVESVPRAIELARAAGIARQSIDLIFGIPGQTLDHWADDLRRALALNTEHLSCYNLTYEPNTAMTARLKRGDFAPAPEDLEVEMYELTRTTLASAGLRRYEVSNYALPGAESQHNLAYWRQHPWLAAGPSASAHLNGCRWKNIPRLDDYLTFDDEGFAPIQDLETADARRALAELVMTGLRLAEGLDLASLEASAAALDPSLPESLQRLIDRGRAAGSIAPDASRLVLTAQGFLIADGIAGEFLAAILP